LLNKEEKLPESDRQIVIGMRKDYSYTVNSYIDSLAAVFKDSPKVLNVIETVDYSHKSLINVTKLYLKDKCKGSDCLRYEKDLSKNQLHYGVFSGAQVSQVSFLYTDTKSGVFSTVPIGVFMNLPVPQLSERLFFQMEMITNTFNFKQSLPKTLYYDFIYYFINIEVNSRTLDFPFLFKYEFTGKKLSPTFAFGKEFGLVLQSKVKTDGFVDYTLDQSQSGKWLCELGMNYKASEDYSLFANLRYKSRSDFNYGIYRSNLFALYIGVKF
jgi:hypothetical protein